ncbi:MAG: hypothetical protein ABIT96_05770 [Ferruginibacter sp.]
MKQILLITMMLGTMCITSKGQTAKTTIEGVKNISVTSKGSNIQVNWQGILPENAASYWLVQGSIDGKVYTTLGYVWGARPGSDSEGAFKYQANTSNKSVKFYRVLTISGNKTVKN